MSFYLTRKSFLYILSISLLFTLISSFEIPDLRKMGKIIKELKLDKKDFITRNDLKKIVNILLRDTFNSILPESKIFLESFIDKYIEIFPEKFLIKDILNYISFVNIFRNMKDTIIEEFGTQFIYVFTNVAMLRKWICEWNFTELYANNTCF